MLLQVRHYVMRGQNALVAARDCAAGNGDGALSREASLPLAYFMVNVFFTNRTCSHSTGGAW
jgi:hypothetical protein